MIDIHIVRDKHHLITKFTISGHAGYDESGKDIVCAAVSVTGYTAIGALAELAGLTDFYTIDDSAGYMMCTIPETLDANSKNVAQIILETTAIGFKQIAGTYSDYTRVYDEEV